MSLKSIWKRKAVWAMKRNILQQRHLYARLSAAPERDKLTLIDEVQLCFVQMNDLRRVVYLSAYLPKEKPWMKCKSCIMREHIVLESAL